MNELKRIEEYLSEMLKIHVRNVMLYKEYK